MRFHKLSIFILLSTSSLAFAVEEQGCGLSFYDSSSRYSYESGSETLANNEEVKQKLASKGYVVPGDTAFRLSVTFQHGYRTYSDHELQVKLEQNYDLKFRKEFVGKVRCEKFVKPTEEDGSWMPWSIFLGWANRCDNGMTPDEFLDARKQALILKAIDRLPTCAEAKAAKKIDSSENSF